MTRFEKLRINDFKNNVIKYLEVLMENQEKVVITYTIHNTFHQYGTYTHIIHF